MEGAEGRHFRGIGWRTKLAKNALVPCGGSRAQRPSDPVLQQRRQLVLLLIDRVVVTDAEVEIRYVLPTSPDSEHVRFCHLRKDYFDHPAPGQEHEAALGLGQAYRLQPDAVLGRSRL